MYYYLDEFSIKYFHTKTFFIGYPSGIPQKGNEGRLISPLYSIGKDTLGKNNHNETMIAEPIDIQSGHIPLTNHQSIKRLDEVKASVPTPKIQTKSESTVAEYQKKWRTIIKRVGENPSEEELIGYFNRQKYIDRKSTFKMYRVAATFILTEQGLTELAHQIQSIQYPSDGIKNLPPASSSSKPKKISAKMYEKLLSVVGEKTSAIALLSLHFIKATINTGLRPSEWLNASIERFEDYAILTIYNAKFTNGRASGETRSLRLEDAESIQSAIKLIELFSTMDETSAKAKLAQCSTFIRLTSIAGMGGIKHKVTPYTLRHQYTANAKKIFSQEKVALAVGHNVTKTASVHYGKKSSAWSDSDLKRVMTHNMNQPLPTINNISK